MTENQINEMFRLMTTTIKKLDNVENRLGNLEGRFDGLEENLNEFKQETKQSFTEVKQELRFMNRKVDVQMEDLMQSKYKVRDVEERVKILEEKDVA